MQKAFIVVGMGFGDEAKGSTVDYLTEYYKSTLTVRFGGGSQCAHNVVRDSKHHTFSQFGSGTLAGAKTHLSQYMFFDPGAFIKEGEHLESIGVTDWGHRVTIDSRAKIITPYHSILNKLREISRGNERHGSCGVGFGECVKDSIENPESIIYAGDLLHPNKITEKLKLVQWEKKLEIKKLDLPLTEEVKTLVQQCNDADFLSRVDDVFRYAIGYITIVHPERVIELLEQNEVVVFEGHQGVLLDEIHGFHPYTTWSNTTFGNALEILKDFQGEVVKLGLMRSYMTRHGPGPFPSETKLVNNPEQHNQKNEWQGIWRQGYLDCILLDYAKQCCFGVDYWVISHMDHFKESNNAIVTGYQTDSPFLDCGLLRTKSFETLYQKLNYQEQMGEWLNSVITNGLALTRSNFLPFFEACLGKVAIVSHGPESHRKEQLIKI